MLNVFIDESGDQGFNFEKGSSKHFLIGFAFFPTTDYKRCVDSVKQGIGARCGKAPKHLHFNSSRDAEKKELLHKMVAVGGKFGYIYEDTRIRRRFLNTCAVILIFGRGCKSWKNATGIKWSRHKFS